MYTRIERSKNVRSSPAVNGAGVNAQLRGNVVRAVVLPSLLNEFGFIISRCYRKLNMSREPRLIVLLRIRLELNRCSRVPYFAPPPSASVSKSKRSRVLTFPLAFRVNCRFIRQLQIRFIGYCNFMRVFPVVLIGIRK